MWERGGFSGVTKHLPSHVGRRHENELGTWIKAAHNGFKKLLGLTHHRRLFLSAEAVELPELLDIGGPLSLSQDA